MANAPFDIHEVLPNLWAVIDKSDPESGTLVRRFERWTCTCADAKDVCRHVTAARSLIANVSAAATKSDNAAVIPPPTVRRRAKRRDDEETDRLAKGEEIAFSMLPPPRKPRAVRVSDRAVTNITESQVAA